MLKNTFRKKKNFKIKTLSIVTAALLTLSACGGSVNTVAPTESIPTPTETSQAESAQSETTAYVGGENVILGGRDAVGTNGVIAAGREDAAQVGIDILKAGGNAVDAAVAMGFTLGVSEQQSSGIGGGGFMMVRFADSGEIVFIDFRDQAPAAASPDMYQVDEKGRCVNQENKIGARAVCVPGEVKGMLYALDAYGSMERSQVMAPAIQMAEEGFEVSNITSRDIKDAYGAIMNYDSTAAVYLDEDGMPYEPGDIIKNPDLANTLKLIAEEGETAFYQGEIADKIVAAVEKEGGILTKEDMMNYEIHVGEPVHGTYRGYDVYSSNLPSSGGTMVLENLNILENYDVGAMDPESAEYFHLLSETFKLTFADRAKFMADPAFAKVPVKGLSSKEYAKERAGLIDMEHAGSFSEGDPWPWESDSTTHFSVMDAEGNMVAVTKTVDATFASAYVAEGTGILLNDTMVDFSLDPESPNCPEGGKRPLSSMSPTLILKDGAPFMALGCPGSTRIITGVTQVISKVIDHNMGLQEAIDAVRMHDDFGTLILEKRVDDKVIEELSAMGHEMNTGEEFFTYPCIQACMMTEEGLKGAADPRRDGIALGY